MGCFLYVHFKGCTMKEFMAYLIDNKKIVLASELENYCYQVYSELNHILKKESCVNTVFDTSDSSDINFIVIKEYFNNRHKKNTNKYNGLITDSLEKVKADKNADLIIFSQQMNEDDKLSVDIKYYYSNHTSIFYLVKKNCKKDIMFIDNYFYNLNKNIPLINFDLINEYYKLYLKDCKIEYKENILLKENLDLKKKLKESYEEIEYQKELNENLINQKDSIKKHLSYRVGNLLIGSVQNRKKMRALPIDMLSEFNDFYSDKDDKPKILKISRLLTNNTKDIKEIKSIKQNFSNLEKNNIINSTKNILSFSSTLNKNLISTKDFVKDYENVRVKFFVESDLKGLYDITYKYVQENIDNFKIFEPILREILQIFFYYEDFSNQNIEKILAMSFLDDYIAKKDLKKISSFFVEFNCILGWDAFEKKLIRSGISFSDIYQKKYFLESIASRPQAFIPALDEEFYIWAKDQPENYELILAKFLYSIIKGKKLDRKTLFGFFNIKRVKFKRRFLDILQRYTYSIKKSINNDGTVYDLINQIKSSEDLVYVSLLISCNSNQNNISNFVNKIDKLNEIMLFDKYQLAYLFSQVGDNSNLTKLINDSFQESFIQHINYLGDKSIYLIYESILNTAINSNKNYTDAKITINVITSTFNPDISLLSLSIDSILKQSHNSLLLTVVDDFSDNSDEIKQLITEKNDERINYLRMPKNGGVYKCRNLAINSIESDFIAFQDDDDISHPQRLEYQLSHLQHNDIEVSMVTNLRIDIDGHVQIDNHSSILSNGPVTMLFSKDLIDKVGLFKEFRSRGDVEFKNRCVRLLGPSSLEVDSKILYYSLGSHNSLSSSFEHGKNNSSLKLIRSLIHYDQTKPNNKLQTHRNLDNKVIACMSSFPARKDKMLLTIDSVVGNVDKLYLYLNNYKEVPIELKKYTNLEVILGEDTKGDLRDNGKIYPFSFEKIEGYCFLIDDDIIYPTSYFNEYIRKIEKYKRKAVVGVHGVIFAKPFQSYFKNREVFHFKNENLTDVVVNQLGTGALAFHTDTLTPTLSKYVETGMADVFFAIEAKQLNVPLICIAHPAGWLKPLDIEIEDTSNLYDEFKNDHSKQTTFIKNAGEFRKIDISDILGT